MPTQPLHLGCDSHCRRVGGVDAHHTQSLHPSEAGVGQHSTLHNQGSQVGGETGTATCRQRAGADIQRVALQRQCDKGAAVELQGAGKQGKVLMGQQRTRQ